MPQPAMLSRAGASENALLLAILVKILPGLEGKLDPSGIRRLLSDPARLSELVREAARQSHMMNAGLEGEAQLALQHALARVSPRHLGQVLAVLEREAQPAVNHDATYGASASLGEAGSGRAALLIDGLSPASNRQRTDASGAADEEAAGTADAPPWMRDYEWAETAARPTPPLFNPWAFMERPPGSWPMIMMALFAAAGLALFFFNISA